MPLFFLPAGEPGDPSAEGVDEAGALTGVATGDAGFVGVAAGGVPGSTKTASSSLSFFPAEASSPSSFMNSASMPARRLSHHSFSLEAWL